MIERFLGRVFGENNLHIFERKDWGYVTNFFSLTPRLRGVKLSSRVLVIGIAGEISLSISGVRCEVAGIEAGIDVYCVNGIY